MPLRKRIISSIAMIIAISILFCCSAAFADTTVVITKNPTSEAVTVGGKTWFIAHADNAWSLTWETVDPNGTVHTLADTVVLNPGIGLQALEGDTLAVTNIPLSFNGWGIQARFDGQGNSATTSPAYIYVGDFLNAYSNIIETYRIAKQNNIRGPGDAYEYNVSEWVAYYDHVGYALKDLDKNGIPELLISGTDPQYSEAPVLFEVYTLVNNTPVQILISWARIRYYLMTDNRIYHEGSGGAAHSIFEFYQVEGDHLRFLEGYSTSNDYDGSFTTLYYSSTWNGETDEFMLQGDYNHPDSTFPIEVSDTNNTVANLFDTFESQCWMPQLTIIG